MLGSLCPITLGHVQGFIEARKMLLGEEGTSRPLRLEQFGEVLGLISLNGSGYVNRKLAEKGVASLGVAQRRELVALATADLPWMGTEDQEGCAAGHLASVYPHLHFTHITMNGADDVKRHHKWEWANEGNRMLTMGRPGDTASVIRAAQRAGHDLDAGHFIMGPELPDISSSDVRNALCNGEVGRAAEMLHPDVLAWCLEKGPWKPTADGV